MTITASELRAALHRVKASRRAIVSLGDSALATYREAETAEYLTSEEREIAKRRTRDEARAKLSGKIEDARLAREAARDEATRRLDKHKVTPEASVRVRRLLDEGLSLGE